MNKAIIGKKLGMSQIFTADGTVIPVTVVEAGPCPVVQVKTKDRDGYEAVKVAFGAIKKNNVNKPDAGQFKKAGVEAKRVLKEFKLENAAEYKVGDEIFSKTIIARPKKRRKKFRISSKNILTGSNGSKKSIPIRNSSASAARSETSVA